MRRSEMSRRWIQGVPKRGRREDWQGQPITVQYLAYKRLQRVPPGRIEDVTAVIS